MWKEDRLVIIHTSQTVTFILIPEKLNKEGKDNDTGEISSNYTNYKL